MYSIVSSFITIAAFAHATAASPARPVAADTVPFDTTQVVVTTNDFAQLLTFLHATAHEWNTPTAQRLMTNYRFTYVIQLGDYGTGVTVPRQLQSGQTIPIPDYSLIADSIPAVAQGLAAAKLTGRRYIQLSRTLNMAWLTDQLDRLAHNGTAQGTDTKSVIGQNIAFIRAHKTEFDQLVDLGLDVVTIKMGQGMGGGASDFNP